jgi:7,8-dihydropterin-6-yl-methyl-4-(beta-D-ribofuranosyl)aminobenzene 5'-phosphate synthase
LTQWLSGGMLRAIKKIKQAQESTNKKKKIIVDLHSNRPQYRGFQTPMGLISLEADPTFDEIHEAGGIVESSTKTHTILNKMFLVSGEIPRITSYELGLRRSMRFDEGKGWTEDILIKDERFLMCKLKGILLRNLKHEYH